MISLQAGGGEEEEVLPLLNPFDFHLCSVSEECSLSRKIINIARNAGRGSCEVIPGYVFVDVCYLLFRRIRECLDVDCEHFEHSF